MAYVVEVYWLYTLALNHVEMAQCTGTADLWADSHFMIALHSLRVIGIAMMVNICYFA